MRIFRTAAALIYSAGICTKAAAKSVSGDRVAVILDAGTPQEEYSQFFEALTNRGFALKFSTPRDELSFFELGERIYDHAILFPQKSKGLGPSLTPQELVKFINHGGNILVGASTGAGAAIRDFAKELEIDLAERDTLMADHFNFDGSSDERHTTIVTSKFGSNEFIISKEVQDGSPIIYKGIGHGLGNSPLLTPVLGASRTAYSYDVKEEFEASEDPWVAGSQAWLVSVFQARNNARVGITGSVEMFSNKALDTVLDDGKIAGNKNFVRELTQWVFQEKSVLRSADLKHSLANESLLTTSPSMYRVKNEVQFSISLQQYSEDTWKPYVANDVQLELIMLDPYIRTKLDVLETRPDFARYSTAFMLPDHYGVFHFKVNYKRNGLTYIEERSQITIRHFRHDEYDRFLSAAYPYYTATATTIGGFLVFCLIWLFSQSKTTAGAKKVN